MFVGTEEEEEVTPAAVVVDEVLMLLEVSLVTEVVSMTDVEVDELFSRDVVVVEDTFKSET